MASFEKFATHSIDHLLCECLTFLNLFLTIVHAAVSSNTFAIYGAGQVKELTELVPGILNQLGADSLASLRKLAESYQQLQGPQGIASALNGKAPEGADDDDDDDVPDLVESFDTAGEKTEGLEELN